MKEFRIIRPAVQDDPNWRPPFWLEVIVLYLGIILMCSIGYAILKMLPV